MIERLCRLIFLGASTGVSGLMFLSVLPLLHADTKDNNASTNKINPACLNFPLLNITDSSSPQILSYLTVYWD